MHRKPQMKCYFLDGHKIGKPSPLFVKIEQAKLDEMKAKYGGQQQAAKTTTTAAAPMPESVADAEKAIAEQGEKVRLLKGSGVEKSVWQPEVEILLKLKKRLVELNSAPPATTQAAAAAPMSVADAEKAVAAQGEKVRLLKTGGAEKSAWQPEVDILLKLKKQLTELSCGPAAAAPSAADGNKKNKKKK